MKSKMYKLLDVIHRHNKAKIKKCILNEGGLNNVMSYASADEPKQEQEVKKEEKKSVVSPTPVKPKIVEKIQEVMDPAQQA